MIPYKPRLVYKSTVHLAYTYVIVHILCDGGHYFYSDQIPIFDQLQKVVTITYKYRL